MTSPGCTLVGTLTDGSGNTVAGTVTMVLCNYLPTPPVVSGSNVFVQCVITATAGTNGQFSIEFYGNYQITLANTYWQIFVQIPGTSAFNDNNLGASYQFLTGGTFDLSTITPMVGFSNPVAPINLPTFAFEVVPT